MARALGVRSSGRKRKATKPKTKTRHRVRANGAEPRRAWSPPDTRSMRGPRRFDRGTGSESDFEGWFPKVYRNQGPEPYAMHEQSFEMYKAANDLDDDFVSNPYMQFIDPRTGQQDSRKRYEQARDRKYARTKIFDMQQNLAEGRQRYRRSVGEMGLKQPPIPWKNRQRTAADEEFLTRPSEPLRHMDDWLPKETLFHRAARTIRKSDMRQTDPAAWAVYQNIYHRGTLPGDPAQPMEH
eukprot:jgi/Mesvir1/19739/Mv01666-RA.1